MDVHWLSEMYADMELVGKGVFGQVLRCENRETKQSVALKVVRFDGKRCGIPQSIIREISILRDMDHPNIVK